ncbi:hypothetical protein [Streptomyces klenkii]|uniref:hypothetical protein n=1 Tax=Streptomyces klenkii TaxID=1420899 RepID=UPI003425F510
MSATLATRRVLRIASRRLDAAIPRRRPAGRRHPRSIATPLPSAGRPTQRGVIERLALLGALLGLFEAVHSFGDLWAQRSVDAKAKRLYGDHLVYADGKPATPEGAEPGREVMTATSLGRRAVWRHVASYTGIQAATTVVATRALGYRVPVAALLAGAAINAGTHAAIDRGAAFEWLADKTGNTGFIDHCQPLRFDQNGNVVAEKFGPGSAWMELDAALHKAIGAAAAVVTVWLATRRPD